MSLYPYQIETLTRLRKHPKMGLFTSMGYGKTLISLELFKDSSDLLIVCPLSVMKVWEQEAIKHGYAPITLIRGDVAKRNRIVRKGGRMAINRELLPWLVKTHKTLVPKHIVIDELRGCRNIKSLFFRALKALPIERLVLLSGTPTPNTLLELFAPMYLIDPNIFGTSVEAFRYKYAVPAQQSGHIIYSWKLKPGAAGLLQEAIKHVAISGDSAIYHDLPEQVNVDIPITLSPHAMKAYKQMKETQVLGENITATSAGVLCNKLQQITSGACYHEDGKTWEMIHLQKLQALEDIIEQAGGEQVLIFYQYKHEVERIMSKFPEAGMLDDALWNAKKQTIALVHPSSTLGRNIQYSKARIMVWFSLGYSLEGYLQSVARLVRQSGTTLPVMNYRLLADETIDYVIVKALDQKENVQEAFLKSLR